MLGLRDYYAYQEVYKDLERRASQRRPVREVRSDAGFNNRLLNWLGCRFEHLGRYLQTQSGLPDFHV